MPAILEGTPRSGKRGLQIMTSAGVAVVLLAATLLVVACNGTSSPQASRPAVLLITIDSLRADRLSHAGHVAAKTPSLDALAARSVRFTSASAHSPQTLPSIATVLTGRLPSDTGVRLDWKDALPESATTLAEALAASGYRTAAIPGSLLLHPRHGLKQGFTQYLDSFAEVPRPREVPILHFAARRVADRALEWLEEAHKEPYFLWINFHDLYDTDEGAVSYDDAVASVDREVGRVIARIKEYGEDERTLIVVAGSHGIGLSDHGEEQHGTLLFESTLHVPLIVKPAGKDRQARVVDFPVGLVDVMPTILEAAGLAAPSGVAGRSLVAALGDGANVIEADRIILAETAQPAAFFGWSPVVAARSGKFKCIISGESPRLFDLAADPGETVDVTAAHPEEARRLAAAASAIPLWAPPRCEDCGAIVSRLGLTWPGVGRSDLPVDPAAKIGVANLALTARRTLRRRKVEAAELLYKEALEKDPENALALRDLALITGLRQELVPARALFTKAQRLFAWDAEIYHMTGHMALVEKGGQPRATELFTLAGRLDPLNEEALYDAACGAAVAGDVDVAFSLLEQAIGAGFRDFGHMRIDKDLDALRGDVRFGTLVPAAPSKGKSKSSPSGDAPGPAAAP